MTESIEDVVQKEVSKQLSQIDLEIEEKIEKSHLISFKCITLIFS